MRFLRWLWRLAALIWPFVIDTGLWFAGAGTLYAFLFLLFFLLFAVAWLFGFSPPEITAWLDDHAALFDRIGDWLWRVFMGFVLLICALGLVAVWSQWFGEKDEPDKPRNVGGGCCGLIAILVFGYAAWVGMTMPMD
ncbi:hypothetical protein [Sphingomonas sp.]|uniref:hypothetical protein n=1 Tax=Sphingomonas sp. TaxID=28214 RepID=UPI003CC69A67